MGEDVIERGNVGEVGGSGSNPQRTRKNLEDSSSGERTYECFEGD